MNSDNYNAGHREVGAYSASLTDNMLEHVMADSLILPPNSKAIVLTRGKYAIVDAADYEWLMQWKWHATPSGRTKEYWYAYRAVANGTPLSMHRAIMEAKKGEMVDHWNRNTLDNRRDNLRLTTKSLNNANSRMRKRNPTQMFKGVGRDNRYTGKNWFAAVYLNKKKIYSHYCYTQEEAARAYDALAIKYFGEFACLNFPPTEVKP